MMKKRIVISELTKYIERLGTGTRDMIKRCKSEGLVEPEYSVSDGFVTDIHRKPAQAVFTGEVTGEVTEEVAGEVRRLQAAIKAKGGRV